MVNPRLAESASPYLRAHADNPVEWFAWGPEPFAEAKRRDVPVFVSIGYSTCHWCHVMARESFADPAIAAILSDGFVAIKVDREEHPDVDAAYMAAASAFTKDLGWPLSVFTTPGGAPFYAGTYFPPQPRGGMPGFAQVLAAVREAWTQRRDQVDGTAKSVVSALAAVRAQAAAADSALPTAQQLAAAADTLAQREDRQFGGFGTEPKFPVATALRFLQAVRPLAPEASAAADRALAAMARSPLRDDVDGGFFRYATRRDWSVPHYERMLTDNAQLLDVAVTAGDRAVAEGIAGFLLTVLQQPSGGFGAAQDSESWIDGQRSEGGYYLRDAAGRADLDPPAVDGKVVTGWNGLAMGALARAATRWDRDDWREAAQWAADAVMAANVRADGALARASLDEVVSPAAATLADYAQLAGGLAALAAATGDVAYATAARDLVAACAQGGAIGVPGGADPVLADQGMQAVDAASDADEPSGMAALADAAWQLWLLGAGDDLRGLAEGIVADSTARALGQPLAHGTMLRIAAQLQEPPRQVVVVTPDAGAPLAAAARGLDADVVAIVTPEQAEALAAAGFSLFDDRGLRDGRPALYDCRGFVCRLPITQVADL